MARSGIPFTKPKTPDANALRALAERERVQVLNALRAERARVEQLDDPGRLALIDEQIAYYEHEDAK